MIAYSGLEYTDAQYRQADRAEELEPLHEARIRADAEELRALLEDIPAAALLAGGEVLLRALDIAIGLKARDAAREQSADEALGPDPFSKRPSWWR